MAPATIKDLMRVIIGIWSIVRILMRQVCGAFTTLVVAVLLLGWAAAVRASAPLVKSQPSFYRMMLGDFEITALNDEVFPVSVKILNGVTAAEIRDRLTERHITDPFEMSFNAFLINTGNKPILIDAGSGGTGHLLANLRAAGYRPEQVDEIYITHSHPDHVGRLKLGSERAFSNAMLRTEKSEADIYLGDKTAATITAAPNDIVKRRGCSPRGFSHEGRSRSLCQGRQVQEL